MIQRAVLFDMIPTIIWSYYAVLGKLNHLIDGIKQVAVLTLVQDIPRYRSETSVGEA